MFVAILKKRVEKPIIFQTIRLRINGLAPCVRASGFEALNLFRVPQNTTCRVPLNTRIRPAERIKCNRENSRFLYQISGRIIKVA